MDHVQDSEGLCRGEALAGCDKARSHGSERGRARSRTSVQKSRGVVRNNTGKKSRSTKMHTRSSSSRLEDHEDPSHMITRSGKKIKRITSLSPAKPESVRRSDLSSARTDQLFNFSTFFKSMIMCVHIYFYFTDRQRRRGWRRETRRTSQ